MYYLLFYDYVEDILERRTPYRAEHLALAQAAHERGELLMVGALAEPVDGAVFIFKTESPEPIEAFVRNDPYVRHGLVTAWRIRPWTVVIGG
uniref:YCII-related domain-containing protein n=1 Tax=Caldilinea aerophila TaxID=133453 RepID=A0A7C1JZB3_9CHLR